MIKQTKYGWVDLSNLSRKGKTFDWKSSVGAVVKFKYFDNEYSMNIMQYIDWNHILVGSEGCNTITMSTSDIIAGKFGKLLGKRMYDFRYCVGDIVNDTMLITSIHRDGNRKSYNYKCLVDGYEGSILEINLYREVGCPVCANKTVMPGVNDIATTNHSVAMLFYDISDANKYTEHSHKQVYFKCPRCGHKIKACIDNVVSRGLSCKKCADGISYPAKFVYNFLQQILSVDQFQTEKIFEWSKNILYMNDRLSGTKIYDFYIMPPFSIIIEAHGQQHFIESLERMRSKARTLTEEQENDKIKMRLALNNNIISDRYVQLDCRYSNKEYIKNSIMCSHLPTLLHFTENQVDWNECDKFATSSRVFEACNLWNNGVRSTTTIGTQMKLGQTTILRYLRRGEELGIVQDPPKHINRKKQNTTK